MREKEMIVFKKKTKKQKKQMTAPIFAGLSVKKREKKGDKTTPDTNTAPVAFHSLLRLNLRFFSLAVHHHSTAPAYRLTLLEPALGDVAHGAWRASVEQNFPLAGERGPALLKAA